MPTAPLLSLKCSPYVFTFLKDITLKHILTACLKELADGRYTWRQESHDTVLTEIAEWVDLERLKTNSNQLPSPEHVSFLCEGDRMSRKTTTNHTSTILHQGSDWELQVELKRQLVFSEEVAIMR